MSFVDTGTQWLLGLLILEHILLAFGRIPESRIVDGRDGEVLGNACDPCRDTLLPFVIVGCYEGDLLWLVVFLSAASDLNYLDLGIVSYGRLAIDRWKCDFEDTKLVLLHLV